MGHVKKLYLIPLLILCISSLNAFAGDKDTLIDSLEQVFYNAKQDSAKARLANALAKQFNHEDQYDSALHYADLGINAARRLNLKSTLGQLLRTVGNVNNSKGDYKAAMASYKEALKITDTVNDKRDMGKLFNNLGTIAENIGDYTTSYKYYNKALSVATRLDSKDDISTSYNNIGQMYHDEGNNSTAIEYYLKALKIEGESNSSFVSANTLNNIGNIYEGEKDFDQALTYYFRAAEGYKKLKTKHGLVTVYNNIGLLFQDKKDFDKALEYLNLSLQVAEDIGAEAGIGDGYNEIGHVYFYKNDLKQSLENQQKALKIYRAIGDEDGISDALDALGSIYFADGNYKEALTAAEEALSMARTIKSPALLSEIHHHLSEVYQKTGQTDKAFENYKAYITLRDSLNNDESTRKIIKSQMAYQFEKTQQAEALQQEKKDAVAKEAARRQSIILYFIIGILILVVFFAIFMVNRFMVIRKQKHTIEEKKAEVENKNKIIEEKNKDITDSINYARDIQRALLPDNAEMQTVFPESFVVYMPKDIVSGDFYWMAQKEGRAFLLAADCTGHGVPGALMSMIGVSLFNETVGKKEITQPGHILREVRSGIIHTFRQKGESQHKDGMDAALCCIDLETLNAEFAGAYNPMWLINKKGEIKEIQADKQPVGIQDGQNDTFTTRSLKLEKEDTIYLFTDGFADQFGGPSGKKFKYKQLQEKLLAIVNLPMEKQKQELESVFQNWKGSLEQVDDVLIIGVRV